MFGLVPNFIGTNALCRTSGHFVNDVGKTKIFVDLLQKRGEVDAFIQDLVFGTEDVAIVLCKAAHAHDAVQAACGLVAVTLTKLTIAQWQIAIALHALLKNQDVAWAVHGLQSVIALFRLCGEHVVAVLVPVACFFPQRLVNDLRAFNFLITVVLVHSTHVLLNLLPNRPAFGMPEDQARCVLVNVKEVQLTT